MKTLKIISINLLVLFVLSIIIEIIFGGWIFKKNSLDGLNVIHDRVMFYSVQDLDSNNSGTIKYSRDQFGLRGTSSFNKPEIVDLLTIGGSTTDQRFIDDEKTWQSVLETNLKTNGINFNISNAGVDGQSTLGHMKNFQLWFPLIPKLKPKYILFYIGLNDFYVNDRTVHYDQLYDEGLTLSKIKDNSALYNLARKINGMVHVFNNKLWHQRIDFSEYNYVKYKIPEDSSYYSSIVGNKLDQYEKRLELLVAYTENLGAEAIFVTQPSHRFLINENSEVLVLDATVPVGDHQINGHDYYYLLNKMNTVVYKVAKNNNLSVIELTNLSIWKEEDFYDFAHMTPSGAQKVGKEIANALIRKIASD